MPESWDKEYKVAVRLDDPNLPPYLREYADRHPEESKVYLHCLATATRTPPTRWEPESFDDEQGEFLHIVSDEEGDDIDFDYETMLDIERTYWTRIESEPV